MSSDEKRSSIKNMLQSHSITRHTAYSSMGRASNALGGLNLVIFLMKKQKLNN